MKTVETKNKDGTTASITTDKDPSDIEAENKSNRFHSAIWAFVVIVIGVIVFLCIRYGKCAC